MKPSNCVIAMAAGQSVSVFLRKDYTLTCTGRDSTPNVMDDLKPEGEYKAIAAGFQFVLAIDKADGHIEQFGETEMGAMPAAPSGVFKKIAASSLTAMAIKNDGSIQVWRPVSNSQVTDKPLTGNYIEIACGATHCLALKDDYTITAWGTNASDECTISAAPSGYHYIAIAAANAVSYTLRTNGNSVVLERWGSSGWGTLPPALPTGVYYTKIVAYHKNAMALRSDGMVDAWGDEEGYNYSSTGVNTVPTNKNCDIKDIACGYSHSHVLKQTGEVLSWGENLWSVCATWHNKCFKYASNLTITSATWGGGTVLVKTDGTVVFASAGENYIPKPLPRVYGKFVKVSCGAEHTLGLTESGKCVGWGNNAFGQCTVPDYTFIDIAAGNGTSFGITTSGVIVGWGADVDSYVTNIPSGIYTKISCNRVRTAVAIKSDGSLVVWHGGGTDEFGGSTPAGTDFVEVSAGLTSQAMALKTDKTVAVWGIKSGPDVTYADPPTVNAGIIEIAAGNLFNAVLYENGTICVWGDTPFNQDVIPDPNRDFIHVFSGSASVIGIKGAKDCFRAVAWGYNGHNECEVGL